MRWNGTVVMTTFGTPARPPPGRLGEDGSARRMMPVSRCGPDAEPEVNLLMPAVMNTQADKVRPMALKPAWDIVNARKTPTAYSGISATVLP